VTVKEFVNLFTCKEDDNGIIVLYFEEWSYGLLLKGELPRFSITKDSKDLIKEYGEREILALGIRLCTDADIPALLVTVSGSMNVDNKEE